MRKKLSKKIKNMTAQELEKHLSKSRKQPLSLAKRKKIRKLIKRKNKDNKTLNKEIDKMATQIINSSLCKMALTLLENQPRLEKIFDWSLQHKDKNTKGLKKYLKGIKKYYKETEKGEKKIKDINPFLVLLTMREILETAHSKGFEEELNERKR